MMRSNKNAPLHARFDCSQGISEATLLAACIDAAGDERDKLLHYLQSSLRNGLGHHMRGRGWSLSVGDRNNQHGAVSLLWSSRSLDNDESDEDNQSNNPRSILKEGVGSRCSDWHDLRKNLLDEVGAEFIPIEIRKTSVDILQLLVDSHAKIYEQQSSDSEDFREFHLIVSTIYVLAILTAIDHLRIESTSCSRLPFSEGQIRTEQGWVPIISPLTLELMIGMPVNMCSSADIRVTPTAVALLRVLTNTNKSLQQPESDSLGIGFSKLYATGVGFSESDGICVTRLMLGESLPHEPQHINSSYPTRYNPSVSNLSNTSGWKVDSLVHIEANLDDTTSEHLAFAVELLLKNGAVDAWVAPITMKKGRSAHTLHCLCFADSDDRLSDTPNTSDKLLEIIFRHTTTLGARIGQVARAALQRSLVTIQTPFADTSRQGFVDVKVGYLNGEVVSMKAEFDHCRTISEETGVPLKNISELVIRLARVQLNLD